MSSLAIQPTPNNKTQNKGLPPQINLQKLQTVSLTSLTLKELGNKQKSPGKAGPTFFRTIFCRYLMKNEYFADR
jgi:hypothetical protein